MITNDDKARFYKSKTWQGKRARILRRDGYLCQLSKRYGKFEPARVVHHIFPFEYYPEYKLESWNLISLSVINHERLHVRNGHLLTIAGWRLLEKTAAKQGIILTAQDKYKCLGIEPADDPTARHGNG